MIERGRQHDTAFLVGIATPDMSDREAHALLGELESLVRTIDMEVVGRIMVKIRAPQPRYLIGGGKADEICEAAKAAGADYIVLDGEISPSQQTRNWDALSELTTIDRHAVILDIFANRARTSVAMLQVELAQMEYFLPRLTNAWSHLNRQRGGRRSTRGEGETQLEMDRRRVQERIASLKRSLKQVSEQRATMRRKRSDVPMPTGSFVGYTNAGKSSLMRTLTGSDVLVANKLFATLDASTRRLELEGGQTVLLTDTVGFIRRLPHDLVEAFKSTLEETLAASFLIHVMDASDPDHARHAEVTRDVLREVGGSEKPTITVLNKCDRIDPDTRRALAQRFPEALLVSATTGEGIQGLAATIREMAERSFKRVSVVLPSARSDLAALIHRTGHVLTESYEDSDIRIEARVPERTAQMVAGFER